MCKGLTRKGFCYLIAAVTYLAGVFEMVRDSHLLTQETYVVVALFTAWALLLFMGIFLLLGTCLPDSHRRSKRVLLRIWIIGALVFGFAIAYIKVTKIVLHWQKNEAQRNILHVLAILFYLVLLFYMVYFPCLYQLELDDEIDY